MNISKYADFFHDGSLYDIRHSGNAIEFLMSSAEVDREEVEDIFPLSRDSCIQGILHIEGIEAITVGDKPFLEIVEQTYDRGRIFEFEVAEQSVEGLVAQIG